MEKIKLTETQKDIVARLNDKLYTVDYLEEWLNRNDNVYINAPAALSAMGASGFYCAVTAMERLEIMQERAAESGEPPEGGLEFAAPSEPPSENKEPAAAVKQSKKRDNKKAGVKQNENESV